MVTPPSIPPLEKGGGRGGVWLLAARPKTLPASATPVLVGIALAFHDGVFHLLPALVTLVCALLLQIGSNFTNDYYDFVKGADNEDRIGPVRVTQSGLLSPSAVRRGIIVVFMAAFLTGLYLVWFSGPVILIVGVACIFFAVLYTAGPFPIAYVGLGEVFVFVFFGIVAVCGTFFIQTNTWTMTAFFASLPIAAISTAIIVVNNYRDIDTDKRAGKKTLAVRIGRTATRIEYAALVLGAYLAPLVLFFRDKFSYPIFLPLLTLPLAIRLVQTIRHTTDGPSLNRALAQTGQLLFLFGITYGIGMLLS